VRLAGGLVAFLLTPFAITGVFRLIDVPTVAPFAAAVLVAAWLWTTRSGLRPVALGIATGAVVHAGFLIWLFRTFYSGVPEF